VKRGKGFVVIILLFGLLAGLTSAKVSAATTFTVTFDALGGTPTPAPMTDLTSGATVVLPTVPTKAGFAFNGWATAIDGTGTTFAATTPVIADITVYAVYIFIPCTVTFDAQGGSLMLLQQTVFVVGATITLPKAPIKTPTTTSFTFNSWNTKADGTGTTFDTTTPVIADITIYAIYTAGAPGHYVATTIPGYYTTALAWVFATATIPGHYIVAMTPGYYTQKLEHYGYDTEVTTMEWQDETTRWGLFNKLVYAPWKTYISHPPTYYPKVWHEGSIIKIWHPAITTKTWVADTP